MGSLSIQQNQARLKVKGKSWDDIATDSGDGLTIDQIIVAEIEDLTGIDLPDIDDDTHIIVGYEDGDPVIYIEGYDEPFDLPDDFDLDNLNLDWELDTEIPIDGALISIDDNLNIVEEELPDHIEIVTLPVKTTYHEGERIDIFGMRVVPKKSDGSTWTNSQYFRGYIPLQELIIDPTTAEKGTDWESGTATCDLIDGILVQPVNITVGYAYTYCDENAHTDIQGHIWYNENTLTGDFTAAACLVGSTLTIVVASTSPATLNWHVKNGYEGGRINADVDQSYTLANQYTHNNKTVYFGVIGDYFTHKYFSVPDITQRGNESFDAAKIAWAIVYGDIEMDDTGTITVTWNRYGDGEPLSATFEITVEEFPGGGGR